MNWYKNTLEFSTRGKGLYPFTQSVEELLQDWGVNEGMCFLFMAHTSASFVISESYDPSAKLDMEEFMERLVPENQAWLRHTMEGPDDSPSHMRAILTSTSLSIPVDHGKLSVGTWQGLYTGPDPTTGKYWFAAWMSRFNEK
jgi:secondary thiamine-phosphate synthase enzyme